MGPPTNECPTSNSLGCLTIPHTCRLLCGSHQLDMPAARWRREAHLHLAKKWPYLAFTGTSIVLTRCAKTCGVNSPQAPCQPVTCNFIHGITTATQEGCNEYSVGIPKGYEVLHIRIQGPPTDTYILKLDVQSSHNRHVQSTLLSMVYPFDIPSTLVTDSYLSLIVDCLTGCAACSCTITHCKAPGVKPALH